MSDLPPPPPPQPWGGPGDAGAGPYQAPGYGAVPPGYGLPPSGPAPGGPSVNGLAIASLITAIVGIPVMLFCFLGWIPWIVAIVLGVVALSQIKASDGRQGGRGLAIGGIATSAACIALTLLGAVVFFVFLREVADDLCDEDRDGDGFDECVDDDDLDPDVGDEDDFDFDTTTSLPR
jgi:hypothetical protein